MTERERMLAGALYRASDPELVRLRRRARRLTRLYNGSSESEGVRRQRLLRSLFGTIAPGAVVEPPFRCDYGFNIHAGRNLYMNFDCVVLDCAAVIFGDDVLVGPGVHFYAATHPLDAAVRASGRELARPITIGSRVWIGGRAVICPGVRIGDGAVVGAGSVVTRDVPSGKVVGGIPARPIHAARVSRAASTRRAPPGTPPPPPTATAATSRSRGTRTGPRPS